VARLYSAAADDLLTALWRFTTDTLYPAANPSEAERLSLIAVGGYGRGVLAPHSDLDLLFLRPWKSIPRTEQVIEFMLLCPVGPGPEGRAVGALGRRMLWPWRNPT
jgi:[protein-PII] uridylyltransferase